MLTGQFQWGCNVLIHSSNPLGSLFVPCAFGLDCIEESYPTTYYCLFVLNFLNFVPQLAE